MRGRVLAGWVAVFLWLGTSATSRAVSDAEGIRVDSVDVTVDQFQDFVGFAHEAMEAEDPAAHPVSNFLNRLNFYRTAANAIRLKQMGVGAQAQDAANMAFLLPFSHGAETLSAPAYLLYGTLTGIPKQVMVPVAAFLGSMAVPGIDWGCIVIIGTYIGSEDFRSGVSKFRIYTVYVAKGVSPFIGVRQFMQRLVVHKDVDVHLRRALSKPQFAEFIHTPEAGVSAHEFTLVSEEQERVGTFTISPIGNGNFKLDSVRFKAEILAKNWRREDYLKLRGHLNRILKPFGWDIRDAILLAFDDLIQKRYSRLVASLPVSHLEITEDRTRFRWYKKVEDCGQHGKSPAPDHDHDHDQESGACPAKPKGDHDHEHGVQVFRGPIEDAGGSDETIVHFIPRAVQIKPMRYYRLSRAFREIPKEICETAKVWKEATCGAIRHSVKGALWLNQHPQYVVYGPVMGVGYTLWFGGKATFKLTRISLQVIRTLFSITLNIVDKGEQAFDWAVDQVLGFGSWVKRCAIRFVEAANEGELPDPPETPSP